MAIATGKFSCNHTQLGTMPEQNCSMSLKFFTSFAKKFDICKLCSLLKRLKRRVISWFSRFSQLNLKTYLIDFVGPNQIFSLFIAPFNTENFFQHHDGKKQSLVVEAARNRCCFVWVESTQLLTSAVCTSVVDLGRSKKSSVSRHNFDIKPISSKTTSYGTNVWHEDWRRFLNLLWRHFLNILWM